MIAAADARYGGTHDAKSKINTAFAKSTDGGKTWGQPTLPLKFDDYVAKEHRLATGFGGQECADTRECFLHRSGTFRG